MQLTDPKIKYIAVATDHTGYGTAARSYIKGFDAIDVDINLEVAKFESTSMNMFDRKTQKLVEKYQKVQYGQYDAAVMHLIPSWFPALDSAQNVKKRFGYMYWETSKIVPDWRNLINKHTDGMFVCCDYTKKALLNSGVTKPVYVVPPAFDTELSKVNHEAVKRLISLPNKDAYKFYTVFQWTERKNPVGLLVSYFTEFTEKDDVVLILKTYATNNTLQEVQQIKQKIQEVKDNLNLKYYPKVALLTGVLSTEEMWDLHHFGDCFVLINRSEGLGIPHIEAGLCGNPVITTNHGSVPELIPQDCAYYVDAFELPVGNMQPQWAEAYKGDQIWADPDIMHCRRHMRSVFEDRDAAKQVGLRAQEYIKENYNLARATRKFADMISEACND